jgi:hypothetical protein
MVNPKAPDRVRALELFLPGLGLLRRLRADARALGTIASYLDETGRALAWSGDEEAPYVKTVPTAPVIKNQIPNPQVAVVPGLQALSSRGRVVEVIALDLRDQTLSPPTIYLQLFDTAEAAQAGDVPMITALPLCTTASYEWVVDALLLENGLYVALSSTALVFTPLAASVEFSLSARVLA